MKLKDVDYERNEELYSVNCVLQMLIRQYDRKIPEDVMHNIEKASNLAENHLAKDFIPEADIDNMKLVSRVTFDMDSIEELQKIRKNLKKSKK